MMKLNAIPFAILFGLWTAFTLAGSVWGFLFLAGPNSVTRLNVIRSDNSMANLIPIFTILLCGGGLWGLGLAHLMNADIRSMVKACAVSWSATLFTFLMVVVALGNTFGGFSRINILPHFRHSLHYNFLLIFASAVGIITTINAYTATSKVGFKGLKKSVGLYTGLAAALGFLAVGLILSFGFGLEVGYPIIGKSGMLKILLLCSIGGSFMGGTAMGWMLSRTGSVRMEQ